MEKLFGLISFVTYGAQALIAVWGAFCVILALRRVRQTSFRSEEQQLEFLGELERNLNSGRVENAVELCDGDPRAIPQLALFALTNRNLGLNTLKRRVAERFQRDVIADLEYRVSWVNTVIKSAPMLGLFGTVIGMMGAFGNLGSGETVDPNRLARDIHFALYTTAYGLATAIPLVICTANIQVRIRKLQDLVDSGLVQLFEILSHVVESSPREP
jgi:biopolymer transport protein ExbB/TolQ